MLSRRPYDLPPPPSREESQLLNEMMVCATTSFTDFYELLDSDGYESADDVFEFSDCNACSEHDVLCDTQSECCSECCSGFGCTRVPIDESPGRSPRAVRFLACQSLAVESSVEPSLDLSAIVASHVARMALENENSRQFSENNSPQTCLDRESYPPGLNIRADEFLPRCAVDNATVQVPPELPLINASAPYRSAERAGDSPDAATAIHVASPNGSADNFSVCSNSQRPCDMHSQADNAVNAGRAFHPSVELIFSPNCGSGEESPSVNSSVNVNICAVIGPESDPITRAAFRLSPTAAPSAARPAVNDSSSDSSVDKSARFSSNDSVSGMTSSSVTPRGNALIAVSPATDAAYVPIRSSSYVPVSETASYQANRMNSVSRLLPLATGGLSQPTSLSSHGPVSGTIAFSGNSYDVISESSPSSVNHVIGPAAESGLLSPNESVSETASYRATQADSAPRISLLASKDPDLSVRSSSNGPVLTSVADNIRSDSMLISSTLNGSKYEVPSSTSCVRRPIDCTAIKPVFLMTSCAPNDGNSGSSRVAPAVNGPASETLPSGSSVGTSTGSLISGPVSEITSFPSNGSNSVSEFVNGPACKTLPSTSSLGGSTSSAIGPVSEIDCSRSDSKSVPSTYNGPACHTLSVTASRVGSIQLSGVCSFNQSAPVLSAQSSVSPSLSAKNLSLAVLAPPEVDGTTNQAISHPPTRSVVDENVQVQNDNITPEDAIEKNIIPEDSATESTETIVQLANLNSNLRELQLRDPKLGPLIRLH